MNRRSQLIIGIALIAMGIGVYSLGLLEQESTVRYVTQLQEAPADHESGEYTLLGIPQPSESTVWFQDKTGTTLTSTEATLASHENGVAQWNVTATVQATDKQTPEAVTTATWSTEATHVFPVQDFGEHGQSVWVVYDGVLPEELRPKPSQLTGHLIPGTPDGLLVFRANDLTVGCSSKFIPEESRAEYDADGDGYADTEVASEVE